MARPHTKTMDLGEPSRPFKATEEDILGPQPDIEKRVDMQFTILAEHEGQFKGIAAALASVQTSVESWKTTAIGVGTVLVALAAVIGALEVYSMQRTDLGFDAVNQQLRSQSERIDLQAQQINSLASDVKALPAVLSDKLTDLASKLVTINREPQSPIIIQAPQETPKH